MEFLVGRKTVELKNENVFKRSVIDNRLLDIWCSDSAGGVKEGRDGRIKYRQTDEGIFCEIGQGITTLRGMDIEEAAFSLYTEIFDFLKRSPAYHLVRIWNYVPSITTKTSNSSVDNTIYQWFNRGRYNAFLKRFGQDKTSCLIPPASAVGTKEDRLIVEFFASDKTSLHFENKVQVPSINYSSRYGSLPPVFSRGTVFMYPRETYLMTAGTASVVGEDSMHAGDIYSQLMESIQNLRILVSQFNLKRYDIHFGFGLEDLVLLRIYYRYDHDRLLIEKVLKKTIDPGCKLSFMKADLCREELLVELEGILRKKGEYGKKNIKKYVVQNEKIRVESLEIHIAEHCNLTCRDCCTCSPYNDKRLLLKNEIAEICRFLEDKFKADVFKVMGGEPLLHPDLVDILDMVRKYNISDAVRVVTNGLLLSRMPDIFWEKIDRLTISNYMSAPIPERHIKSFWEKAKMHGVSINIKNVDQFNKVLKNRAHHTREKVEDIYRDCWIRHRCLMVRNGIFFKCSRAAYMDSLCEKLHIQKDAQDPESFSKIDGVPLSSSNFIHGALEYLNSEVPLATCRYCLGGSGPLIECQQIPKKDIISGEAKYYC